MGTQLQDIDILNYYMYKYVEAIELLLEFELLYNIEFLKKDGTSLFLIVELLPEFEFNS